MNKIPGHADPIKDSKISFNYDSAADNRRGKLGERHAGPIWQ